ncbi:hypothetical protein [Paraburkholderia tropica]|uniref:hypothetical protein n=1 Tax=Paraburkholderia tropica TaxID=92647 RepID=UPI001590C6FE|nr:hypothetical protein [Paraburkholderia tropica]
MSDSVVQVFADSMRSPEDYLYVLLDPLAGCNPDHPLHADALKEKLGEDALVRLPRPDFAHVPEMAPALVMIAAPGAVADHGMLALLQAYAHDDEGYRKRYVCGWLTAPLRPEAMASHIVALCHAAQPAEHGPFIPLYEPPRLELWAAALRGDLGAYLWPIRQWLYPVSWGGFVLFNGSPGSTHGLPPVAHETQAEAALVSTMLAAWRRSLCESMSYAPWRWQPGGPLPPQAASRAFRMIRDARRSGLRNNEDIIVLALHRVTVHPDLAEHERIRADLVRAAKGEASLSELFQDYDSAALQYVASSLPHAKDYP